MNLLVLRFGWRAAVKTTAHRHESTREPAAASSSDIYVDYE